MNKKVLTLLITSIMIASAHAVPIKSEKKPEQGKKASEQAQSNDDFKTLNAQNSTSPKLVQPFMPTHRGGSWRFGLWRNKYGGYYHKGMDFSGITGGGSDKIVFTDNGVITKKSSSYNQVHFKRPNKDKAVYLHGASWTSKKVGDSVKAGEYAITMGGKGKVSYTAYAKHLQYEYHVPRSSGRDRFLGLGGSIAYTTRGRGITTHRDSIGSQSKSSGYGYVVTDPTPYLPHDVIYNWTNYDKMLEKYIGNSARTQFNTLYRPVPLLPVGKGAILPTRKFANLPVFKNYMTPEEIAAMSTSAVNASIYANAAGYGIDGQLLSHRMMASIFSSANGSDWGDLPQPPLADISKMTPQEIITDITYQRYGNLDWQRKLLKLSSKGLLTEYVMLTAAQNYLSQQNQRLKNRVELQLASLNQARLFKFNKNIEAMNIALEADAVPKIIDLELQQLPSGYYANTGAMPSDLDLSNLPNDLNGLYDALLDAIAMHEGPSYDAYNDGQSCGNRRSYGHGNGPQKPTQMTPVEILRTYKPNYRVGQIIPLETSYGAPCSTQIFASGFVQTIPTTLSELVKRHPEIANQPYTGDVQRRLAKSDLLLRSIHKSLRNFLINGGNDEQLSRAVLGLAKTWASIGVPVNGGVGYTSYHGSGNRAFKDSTDAVWAVMKKIQMYHNGSLSTTEPEATESEADNTDDASSTDSN